MYNIGLTHTDIFTVRVGIIESIGQIAVAEINVWTIHMEAYGDKENEYTHMEDMMAVAMWKAKTVFWMLQK